MIWTGCAQWPFWLRGKTDVDMFKWAGKAGIHPSDLDDIIIKGEKIEPVQHQFKKLHIP